MNCPNCGYKLAYDDQFCMRCGKPVQQESNRESDSLPKSSRPVFDVGEKPTRNLQTPKSKPSKPVKYRSANNASSKPTFPSWAIALIAALVIGVIAGVIIRVINNNSDSYDSSVQYQMENTDAYTEEPAYDTDLEATAFSDDTNSIEFTVSDQPTEIPSPVITTPTPVVATPEPTLTPEPTPMPTLAELSDDLEYRVQITGDKVNVRVSPNKDSSLIKTAYAGDTFPLIEQSVGNDGAIWFNISNRAGQVGWVSSQYSKIIISPKATPTPVPTEAPANRDDEDYDIFDEFDDDALVDGFNNWADESYIGIMEVYNCDDWVSLRSKPSTKASRLEKVPKGEILDAYDCGSDTFYMCAYNGQDGYILKKYLKPYE